MSGFRSGVIEKIERFSLCGLLVAVLGLVLAAPASAEFSVAALSASSTSSIAGGHPDLTTELTFAMTPSSLVDGNVRDVAVDLPPGMVGDPTAVPQCLQSDFAQGVCQAAAQVGSADLILMLGETAFPITVPVYNMQPRNAEETAEIAFSVIGLVNVHMPSSVRTDGDYGLTVSSTGISRNFDISHVALTIWGVPADASHDSLRANMLTGPVGPSQLARVPFLTNPGRCDAPLKITVKADSYQLPGVFSEAETSLPQQTGCESEPFDPEFDLRPQSRAAGEPSAYEATLTIPQNKNPDGQAAANLRDAVITLPAGVRLSPGAASGLGACSDADLHVGSTAPAACPDSAKLGEVEIDTPILAKPIEGSVYLRQPLPGHLFRIALVADDFGVHLKVPGEVEPDPATGQLTATFDEAPQLPFEMLTLDFKGGPRAALVNPPSCGTYTTTARFTPWSGGQERTSVSSFQITENCDAASQFTPALEAGTRNPAGGSYSPFTLRLTDPDGQANVASLEATLPEGLLAKLAGVPLCGDAQAATGDCPAASQVGTATVGAGAGSSPIYVPQPGKEPTGVYLAGPYNGAPYSLVVKVPAQAGPFDLGTVTVRNALYVDPSTTQVTAKSDPLPQILEGVPISYRDIRVEVNRPEFTLNPTGCEATQVSSRVVAADGQSANPSSRFQAADCESLQFEPKLALSLKGATKRTGHPALKATLSFPLNGSAANIAKAEVGLPHSLFLDQGNLNNVCKQADLKAGTCPTSSIYGKAKAWTPLLEKPLEGPVYLGVGYGHKLPDLVADLNGPIRILLNGKVDTTKQKGLRNTFEAVPDAPVSKFTLELKGGKKYGLIVNSENLCAKVQKASVQFTAQNGKALHLQPRIKATCKKQGKQKKH